MLPFQNFWLCETQQGAELMWLLLRQCWQLDEFATPPPFIVLSKVRLDSTAVSIFVVILVELTNSEANPKNNWMRGDQACLPLPFLFPVLIIRAQGFIAWCPCNILMRLLLRGWIGNKKKSDQSWKVWKKEQTQYMIRDKQAFLYSGFWKVWGNKTSKLYSALNGCCLAPCILWVDLINTEYLNAYLDVENPHYI